jgi:hypothetical protein
VTTRRLALGRSLTIIALLAVLGVVVALVGVAQGGQRPRASFSDRPPDANGYFSTRPVGSWRHLPGDGACARLVHKSAWEPRPDNHQPNHRMPNVKRVHASLAARPRAVRGAYPKHWDRWVLQRVTGHYTGTTDEIIQWAACKWGISDNLLRAIAVRESNWYQYEVYPDGTCVVLNGCGDLSARASAATREFCVGTTDRLPGRPRFAPGRCPKTFSIVGVMAWQKPSWGAMPGNQNGTFPFSVESTAFALDYLGSVLRGCYEGWMSWLGNAGHYQPGHLRGCVGAWYAGSWRSPEADAYVHNVDVTLRSRPWLRPRWIDQELPCSPAHGCPRAPS